MSVEEEVLRQVKENLDNKITDLTNQINIIENRMNKNAPAITEARIHLDQLTRATEDDRRNLHPLREQLNRTINLKQRLESGEDEIIIRRRR